MIPLVIDLFASKARASRYPNVCINQSLALIFLVQVTKQSFEIAESQLVREKERTSEPDRKVSYVVRLFSDGTKEYAFLLKVLSFGRDRYWRNELIRRAGTTRSVLDIACGPGQVTFDFARKGAYAVGVDVTLEMLNRAVEGKKEGQDVDFVLARAENLPFRSDSFEASTISLALRNVSSQLETVSEMRRCVKSGSFVMSLDFARPKSRFFRPFYNFYIFKVLPTFGLLISKHWNVIILYLANSIEKSRDPEKIESTMDSLGLHDLSVKKMTHGTTAIVSGKK